MSEAETKVHSVQLDEIQPRSADRGAQKWVDSKVDLIRDVKVVITAYLGSGELTVAQLFALKEGDSVTLDRALDAPVDLHLEGQVIARGQIVVVGEKFGVRITEILTGA